LLFAYLGWWEEILGYLGRESIYMNRGFYLFSSTVLCVIWLFTVFFIDHLSFWRFRPGRLPMSTWGIVDKSYDTDNMILVKRQDDLFRHWPSASVRRPAHANHGGRGVEENVANVLFVIGKMSKIQRLIATKPMYPTRLDRNQRGCR